MNIELLKKAKVEATKIEKKVAVYFEADKNNETSHCILRFKNENGTLGNRGFVLQKTGDKVHNGELYDHKIRKTLELLFNHEKNEVSTSKKDIKLKGHNVSIRIKPAEKKVRYYLNGNVIFVLRKVKQDDGTYKVSDASLNKAAVVVEDELIKIFRTTPNDFRLCKEVIEAVVPCLLS